MFPDFICNGLFVVREAESRHTTVAESTLIFFHLRHGNYVKVFSKCAPLIMRQRYSESLFAFCSFCGLWQFVAGRTWTAALLFGLSSGVRSNGVLHAGFFLFQAMHCAYIAATQQGRCMVWPSLKLCFTRSGSNLSCLLIF